MRASWLLGYAVRRIRCTPESVETAIRAGCQLLTMALGENRKAQIISGRTDVGQLFDFKGERGVLEGLLHLIPTKDTCKHARM